MYKNQLQELAQRSNLNLPSYACVREGPDHAPRFKASVSFNGETFHGPSFCNTLRQAEHAAAEVALHMLSKQGPAQSLASRILDEIGLYKNLLQEAAQKADIRLPVYTNERSGPRHMPLFVCTVELAGMNFTGEAAKTKKQAEKNAAIAAWSALKQRVSKVVVEEPLLSDSSVSNEQDKDTIARYLANVYKCSEVAEPSGKLPAQHPSHQAQEQKQEQEASSIQGHRNVVQCIKSSSFPDIGQQALAYVTPTPWAPDMDPNHSASAYYGNFTPNGHISQANSHSPSGSNADSSMLHREALAVANMNMIMPMPPNLSLFGAWNTQGSRERRGAGGGSGTGTGFPFGHGSVFWFPPSSQWPNVEAPMFSSAVHMPTLYGANCPAPPVRVRQTVPVYSAPPRTRNSVSFTDEEKASHDSKDLSSVPSVCEELSKLNI